MTMLCPNGPNWADAPAEFLWCAQDQDGAWYWYSTLPEPSLGGGVWRSNSRHQRFACHGNANPNWLDSLQARPSSTS